MVVMSPDFCLACGNYSDDRDEEAFIIGTNPIIYCSLCHIGVHMKCVGLESVPEDFICDKCKYLKRGELLFLSPLTRRRRSKRSALSFLSQCVRISLPVQRLFAESQRQTPLHTSPLLSLPPRLRCPLVLSARSAVSPSECDVQRRLSRPLFVLDSLHSVLHAIRSRHEASATPFCDAFGVQRGEKISNEHSFESRRADIAEHLYDGHFQQHQNGVYAFRNHSDPALRGLSVSASQWTGRFLHGEPATQQSPHRSYFVRSIRN